MASVAADHLKSVDFERPGRPLYVIYAIICLIKLAFYVADHGVKVVLGDSGSYLAAAISPYVPPDRSYSYGVFLQYLRHISHSLEFIVVVQVALSAIASILLAWVAYRVLRFPIITTALCGIVCAVEPLQLLSERYILSEAISTCFFAVVMSLAFRYLDLPRFRDLLWIAVAGMLLVSFRVYFLPALLITAVFLPLATDVGAAAWREFKSYVRQRKIGRVPSDPDRDLFDFNVNLRLIQGRFRFQSTRYINWPAEIRNSARVIFHVLGAVISLQVLLFFLRAWYGHAIGGPPAYMEHDGLFLLADISPIVQESDFRNRELGHLVFSNLRLPQHEKASRHWNRWGGGGMIDVLNKEVPLLYPNSGPWEANKIAKRTALRALERHPADAIRLIVSNMRDYFTPSELRAALINNEFVDVEIIPSYQDLFRRFNWNITYQGRSGIVRELHERSAYWCIYLAACPFLATVALCIPGLPRKRFLLYGTLCAWPLWSVSTFLPEELAPRYFTGLAWLLILLTGLMVQGVIDLWRERVAARQTERSAHVLTQ